MLKNLLLTTALALVLTTPAFADNSATITQSGAAGDTATISQTGGNDNDADADLNVATVTQVDSYNTAAVTQSGIESTATVLQSNLGGSAGTQEWASISQTPDPTFENEENNATINQIGQLDSATITQGANSSTNTASIYQGVFGGSYQNSAIISQGSNGDGALAANDTATIYQGLGGSSTSSSTASISQDGQDENATINQSNFGTGEFASIIQGENTLFENATITQTGSSDIASVVQNGSNDTVTVTQNGSGNYSLVNQDFGSGNNTATVNQDGSGNFGTVYQSGTFDVATIGQTGAGNYATVAQYAPNNTASVSQVGGGIAVIVQH